MHGVEQPVLRLIRDLYKAWRPQLLRWLTPSAEPDGSSPRQLRSDCTRQ